MAEIYPEDEGVYPEDIWAEASKQAVPDEGIYPEELFAQAEQPKVQPPPTAGWLQGTINVVPSTWRGLQAQRAGAAATGSQYDLTKETWWETAKKAAQFISQMGRTKGPQPLILPPAGAWEPGFNPLLDELATGKAAPPGTPISPVQLRDPTFQESIRQAATRDVNLEEMDRRSQEAASYPLTKGMIEFQSKKGFWDTLAKIGRRPWDVLPGLVLQSAVSSAPSTAGALAGTLVAGPPGAMILGGAGGYLTEYQGRILDALHESGVDFSDREAVIRTMNDPGVLEKWTRQAHLKALPISIMDAAGALVGSVLGQQVATGQRTLRSGLMNFAKAQAIEAPFSMEGEALGQDLSGQERSWPDIWAEAFGGMGTGAVTGGGAYVAGKLKTTAEEYYQNRRADEIKDIIEQVYQEEAKAGRPAPFTPPDMAPPMNPPLDTSATAPGVPPPVPGVSLTPEQEEARRAAVREEQRRVAESLVPSAMMEGPLYQSPAGTRVSPAHAEIGKAIGASLYPGSIVEDNEGGRWMVVKPERTEANKGRKLRPEVILLGSTGEMLPGNSYILGSAKANAIFASSKVVLRAAAPERAPKGAAKPKKAKAAQPAAPPVPNVPESGFSDVTPFNLVPSAQDPRALPPGEAWRAVGLGMVEVVDISNDRKRAIVRVPGGKPQTIPTADLYKVKRDPNAQVQEQTPGPLPAGSGQPAVQGAEGAAQTGTPQRLGGGFGQSSAQAQTPEQILLTGRNNAEKSSELLADILGLLGFPISRMTPVGARIAARNISSVNREERRNWLSELAGFTSQPQDVQDRAVEKAMAQLDKVFSENPSLAEYMQGDESQLSGGPDEDDPAGIWMPPKNWAKEKRKRRQWTPPLTQAGALAEQARLREVLRGLMRRQPSSPRGVFDMLARMDRAYSRLVLLEVLYALPPSPSHEAISTGRISEMEAARQRANLAGPVAKAAYLKRTAAARLRYASQHPFFELIEKTIRELNALGFQTGVEYLRNRDLPHMGRRKEYMAWASNAPQMIGRIFINLDAITEVMEERQPGQKLLEAYLRTIVLEEFIHDLTFKVARPEELQALWARLTQTERRIQMHFYGTRFADSAVGQRSMAVEYLRRKMQQLMGEPMSERLSRQVAGRERWYDSVLELIERVIVAARRILSGRSDPLTQILDRMEFNLNRVRKGQAPMSYPGTQMPGTMTLPSVRPESEDVNEWDVGFADELEPEEGGPPLSREELRAQAEAAGWVTPEPPPPAPPGPPGPPAPPAPPAEQPAMTQEEATAALPPVPEPPSEFVLEMDRRVDAFLKSANRVSLGRFAEANGLPAAEVAPLWMPAVWRSLNNMTGQELKALRKKLGARRLDVPPEADLADPPIQTVAEAPDPVAVLTEARYQEFKRRSQFLIHQRKALPLEIPGNARRLAEIKALRQQRERELGDNTRALAQIKQEKNNALLALEAYDQANPTAKPKRLTSGGFTWIDVPEATARTWAGATTPEQTGPRILPVPEPPAPGPVSQERRSRQAQVQLRRLRRGKIRATRVAEYGSAERQRLVERINDLQTREAYLNKVIDDREVLYSIELATDALVAHHDQNPQWVRRSLGEIYNPMRSDDPRFEQPTNWPLRNRYQVIAAAGSYLSRRPEEAPPPNLFRKAIGPEEIVMDSPEAPLIPPERRVVTARNAEEVVGDVTSARENIKNPMLDTLFHQMERLRHGQRTRDPVLIQDAVNELQTALDVMGRMERKEPPWIEFTDRQSDTANPAHIGEIITAGGRDKEQENATRTRRVAVVYDRTTGNVWHLSVYKQVKRGQENYFIRDPEKPDPDPDTDTKPNINIERFLNKMVRGQPLRRYVIRGAFYVGEPVFGFAQQFITERQWEQTFGAAARERYRQARAINFEPGTAASMAAEGARAPGVNEEGWGQGFNRGYTPEGEEADLSGPVEPGTDEGPTETLTTTLERPITNNEAKRVYDYFNRREIRSRDDVVSRLLRMMEAEGRTEPVSGEVRPITPEERLVGMTLAKMLYRNIDRDPSLEHNQEQAVQNLIDYLYEQFRPGSVIHTAKTLHGADPAELFWIDVGARFGSEARPLLRRTQMAPAGSAPARPAGRAVTPEDVTVNRFLADREQARRDLAWRNAEDYFRLAEWMSSHALLNSPEPERVLQETGMWPFRTTDPNNPALGLPGPPDDELTAGFWMPPSAPSGPRRRAATRWPSWELFNYSEWKVTRLLRAVGTGTGALLARVRLLQLNQAISRQKEEYGKLDMMPDVNPYLLPAERTQMANLLNRLNARVLFDRLLRRVGVNYTMKVFGMLSTARLLNGRARVLGGDVGRANSWMLKIDPVGNTGGGIRRGTMAMEGYIPSADIPAYARDLLEFNRLVNTAIGRVVEPVAAGSFMASGRVQRILTPFGIDMIIAGKGDLFNQWVDATLSANAASARATGTPRLTRRRLLGLVSRWRTALTGPGPDTTALEAISQDFVRQVPVAITHLRTKGFGGKVVGWEEVLYSHPAQYFEQTAIRNSHVRGLREQIPQGPGNAFGRFWREIMSQVGSLEDRDEYVALMRALQGHPTDSYASAGIFRPDAPLGAMFRFLNATLGNLMSRLVLTGQIAVQPMENIFGTNAQVFGYKNAQLAMNLMLKDLRRGRQFYQALVSQGMINRAIADWTYDPSSPVRSVFRFLNQGISKVFMEQFFNELQELHAAATARVVADKIRTGMLTEWEIRTLPSTLKKMEFTDGEVDLIMGRRRQVPFGFQGPSQPRRPANWLPLNIPGPRPGISAAAERLLQQFERRAAGWLTGGNKAIAEGSSLGSNRLFNSVFRFHLYPMTKMNQLRRTFSDVYETLWTNRATTTRQEKATSVEMAARMIFGNTLQGMTTVILTTLLFQGTDGLKIKWEEFKEHPFRTLMEAFSASMSGPLYLLWRGVSSRMGAGPGGWVRGTLEQLGNMAFPYSIGKELNDAIWGYGNFSNMDGPERMAEFVRRKMPGLKIARVGAAFFGLSNWDTIKFENARTAFYRWRNQNMGFDRGSDREDYTEYKKEFYKGMRQAVQGLREGDFDAFTDGVIRAAQDPTAKGMESVMRSFASRKILIHPGSERRPFTLEEELDLEDAIGSDAFYQLKYYDLMLEALGEGQFDRAWSARESLKAQ